MAQYADQLFLFLDDVNYEMASVSIDNSLGEREAVPSMNPTGRPLGTRKGVGACDFTIEFPIRQDMPRWAEMVDKTFKFVQRVDGTPHMTATGVFWKKQGLSATEKGEQVLRVDFGCLNLIEGQ